jgi:hypothetical protein
MDGETRTPDNIAVIHSVKANHAANRLYGPEAESNNRVLRKYSNPHDYLEFNFVTKMDSRFGLIFAFPTNKFFVADSKTS